MIGEFFVTFDKCFAAGLTKKTRAKHPKRIDIWSNFIKHCGDTIPKFNSSPLKSEKTIPTAKDHLPFPPFFRGKLVNSGGVTRINRVRPVDLASCPISGRSRCKGGKGLSHAQDEATADVEPTHPTEDENATFPGV